MIADNFSIFEYFKYAKKTPGNRIKPGVKTSQEVDGRQYTIVLGQMLMVF